MMVCLLSSIEHILRFDRHLSENLYLISLSHFWGSFFYYLDSSFLGHIYDLSCRRIYGWMFLLCSNYILYISSFIRYATARPPRRPELTSPDLFFGNDIWYQRARDAEGEHSRSSLGDPVVILLYFTSFSYFDLRLQHGLMVSGGLSS